MIAVLVKGGMVQEVYTDAEDQTVGVVVHDFDCDGGSATIWVPVYDPDTVREAVEAVESKD